MTLPIVYIDIFNLTLLPSSTNFVISDNNFRINKESTSTIISLKTVEEEGAMYNTVGCVHIDDSALNVKTISKSDLNGLTIAFNGKSSMSLTLTKDPSGYWKMTTQTGIEIPIPSGTIQQDKLDYYADLSIVMMCIVCHEFGYYQTSCPSKNRKHVGKPIEEYIKKKYVQQNM